MSFVFDRPVRDHAVFPKRPGVDYVTIAEDAVSVCLAHMERLATLEHQISYIEQRLRDGDQWFNTHSQNDPKYVTALRQMGRLIDQAGQVLATDQSVAFDLWHACCRLYAALTHVPERVAAHIVAEIGIGVPDHPQAVWDILTGGRAPPASWPLQESDYHIHPGRAWHERTK